MEDLYGSEAAASHEIGRHLALTVHEIGQREWKATATIEKAFTPFSRSQVLLVSVTGVPAISNRAVLKIYDPRFMKERKGSSIYPSMPWSLEVEIAALEYAAAIARGERQVDEDTYYREDPVLFEEYLQKTAQATFEIERTAYKWLHKFQGTTIPRCYGSGIFHPSSPNPTVPRPFHPPFLLLEYIEGEPLETVDPKRVPRSVVRTLLEQLNEFPKYGVTHGDLHAQNVLFVPLHGLVQRAVIIDFGEGYIRGETYTDELWKQQVACVHDLWTMCHILHEKGVRQEDPRHPFIDTVRKRANAWNKWAENHSRWCDPTVEWVSPDGVQLEQPILWKLKPEVVAWLNDPSCHVGVDPPRPGSPPY